MNHESAKALVWMAGIVIMLALVVISPSGGFALLILAAVCAAIALAAGFYPAFKQDYSGYLQHGRAQEGLLVSWLLMRWPKIIAITCQLA